MTLPSVSLVPRLTLNYLSATVSQPLFHPASVGVQHFWLRTGSSPRSQPRSSTRNATGRLPATPPQSAGSAAGRTAPPRAPVCSERAAGSALPRACSCPGCCLLVTDGRARLCGLGVCGGELPGGPAALQWAEESRSSGPATGRHGPPPPPPTARAAMTPDQLEEIIEDIYGKEPSGWM